MCPFPPDLSLEESCAIFSIMICEVLENTHYIPRCLFFGLDKLSSLSLSLIIMCFWPSVILVALLWTNAICQSPPYNGELNWDTVGQKVSCFGIQVKKHLSQPAGSTDMYAAQYAVNLCCHKGTLLIHIEIVLLTLQVLLCPTALWELFHPGCKTLHFTGHSSSLKSFCVLD